MARATLIQPSFAAGELDPALDARVDLARWRVGLATCENFLVLPQGGVTRRPGLRHVADAADGTGQVRLVPFVATTEQAFVLAFTAGRARVHVNDGVLLGPGGAPVEIATPYGAGDLARLAWAQSGDVLYLAHPDHAPRRLVRRADASFAIEPMEAANGPFRPEGEGVTLAASGEVGTVTLVASAPVFEAGHVGALFRLSEPSGMLPYRTWRSETDLAVGNRIRYEDRVYEVVGAGNTGTTPPTHDAGDAYTNGNLPGGVTLRYLHDGRGTVRILSVASPTSAQAQVLRRLPGTAPTVHWQEGAWSAARGWPRAVTLFGQRLWFAATRSDPLALWSSHAADLGDFTDGTKADDAVVIGLVAPQANVVAWLAASDVLVAGTSSGVFAIDGQASDEAIGPDNVRVARATIEGAAAVQPAAADETLLYAARGRRRLIEFAAAADLDGWRASDLSLTAEHAARPGLTELAWAAEPGRVLWMVAGGALVGVTYRRDQEILAWHRHPTDGTIESIAAIPGPDGGADQLWLAVRRTANGIATRRIERMADPFVPTGPDDRAGLAFLDAAARFDGRVAAGLTPSGLAGTVAVATSADVFAAGDVGRLVRAGDARGTVVAVAGPRAATLRVTVPFASTEPVPAGGWALSARRLSGLDHLAGRAVAILADGAPAGRGIVTVAGTLDLPRPAFEAEVGLPYASRLETLPVEPALDGGTGQSRPKRVVRVAARLSRSAGGTVAIGDGPEQALALRPVEAALGRPPAWFSGDVAIAGAGGWDGRGRVRLSQDQPLPMTVLALVATVQTSEG